MIQLTKGFAMIADDCCYTVGKPRQKAVEVLPAVQTGNYISQAQDGEKEA